MLMQQMSKEAVLVALKEEPQSNRERFKSIVQQIESGHWAASPRQCCHDWTEFVARTEDACTIRQMRLTLDRFSEFVPLCEQITATNPTISG